MRLAEQSPLLQALDNNENNWIASVASGIFIIFAGLYIWNAAMVVPYMNWLSPAVILFGLVYSFLVVLFRHNARYLDRLLLSGLGVMTLAFAAWVYIQVYGSPAYGTDEVAFDQYAAQLLIHGLNPYRHSMAPSLNEFLVPPIFQTFTLSGGTVASLSYPALSFMAYVPFMLMGLHTQVAIYVDSIAWIITVYVLYGVLPRPWRWLAMALFSGYFFNSYAVGGVTDFLFLPFLVIALNRWDTFTENRGVRRYIGPVALGVAMAVKQTPWFFAPFLLLGIALEAHAQKKSWFKCALQYAGTVIATFLVCNLPFDVASPIAWAKAIILPLTADTIPYGQGLLGFTFYQSLGGGMLKWYGLLGALFFVLALMTTGFYYQTFKRLWPAFIPLAFFWPTRSLSEYLIDLFPAIVVGMITVKDTKTTMWPQVRYLKGAMTAGMAGGFVLVLAVTLLSPQPLRLTVLREQSTGQLRTLDKIWVQVDNRSRYALQPHFTVNGNGAGEVTSFWDVIGPRTLAAHHQAVYQLIAPNIQSMPSIDNGYHIIAFTERPPTMSISRLYRPRQMTTVIEPQSINSIQRLNYPVEITVQLRNLLGRRIHAAHVPVALSQVIYGQNALIPAEASINGRPEGQTPVIAQTNTKGVAYFIIRGVQEQNEPLYFQAYIDQPHRYPYGYSNILVINFGGK